MRDLIDILAAFESLSAERVPMALATIVAVEGSSYRRPGARMLIAIDGRRFGTVSGGCLEADVARRAHAVIANNTPTLCRYETGDDPDTILYLDDETANCDPGVSLGCGGAVEIFIEPISTAQPGAMPFIADAIRRNVSSTIGLIYRVGGNADAHIGYVYDLTHDLTKPNLPLPVRGERAGERASSLQPFEPETSLSAKADLRADLFHLLISAITPTPSPRVQGEGECSSSPTTSFRRLFVTGGWIDILIETITPPPHLMILGDGPDALPLIELAKFQGWRTTVVGYRAGTKLPGDVSIHLTDHDEVDLAIDPAAAVVVMTHDLLRDARLLRRLAEAPPAYVGVLGPLHRTRRLLAAADIDESIFAGRLFAPIGLDLGGEGPQRVALSIIAEIAAVFSDHATGHLRDKAGGIHESSAASEPASTR